MFAVGDHVVYGYEGVCRVDEVCRPRMSGLDKSREYYRLTPYYKGGTIYAPVDGKVAIRPVMTRQELDALLPQLSGLPPLEDAPADGRQAAEYYRAILAEHSCRRLLQLCKTFYNKQLQLSRIRRSINSTDLRTWKTAEEMLLSEFAFILGQTPRETRELLRSFVQ